MNKAARRLLTGGLLLAWAGGVMYQDPRRFVDSVTRLRHPPVDADAVAELAAGLPGDYKAIERFVHEYVPYRSAWEVYGVPWYYPTVKEVLADRAGDCQARAILMASILEAKGMPYTMRYSLDHVWVDYPGKEAEGLEDPAKSFVASEGKGWAAKLPRKLPVREIVKERLAYHWAPMPRGQKALLLGGAALLAGRAVGRLFKWHKPE
jgi:hypothetical protein